MFHEDFGANESQRPYEGIYVQSSGDFGATEMRHKIGEPLLDYFCYGSAECQLHENELVHNPS